MYWGDARLDRIETSYLNGSGRRIVLEEKNAHYYAFLLHGGNIYTTDWASTYVQV